MCLENEIHSANKTESNEKLPNTKVTQIIGIAVFANVLVTKMAEKLFYE